MDEKQLQGEAGPAGGIAEEGGGESHFYGLRHHTIHARLINGWPGDPMGGDKTTLEMLGKLAARARKGPFQVQDDELWAFLSSIRATALVSAGIGLTVKQHGDQWQTDHVLCFDAKTGAKLWQTDFGMGREFPWCLTAHGAGINSPTPCVADGRLFINGSASHTYRLDASTGKVLWQAKNDHKEDAIVASSFLVLDGNALAVSGMLTALDPGTGKVLWKQPKVTGEANSITLWHSEGRPLLLANGGDAVVHCVSPADGTVLWSVSNAGDYASPAADGKYMALRGQFRLNLAGYEIWPEACRQLWRFRGPGDRGSTPILYQGHVYAWGRHNYPAQTRCVEMASGKVMWKAPRDFDDWEEINSPIRVNDKPIRIHAGNNQRFLMMLQATPTKCDLRGKMKLEGAIALSTPAFADGKLYVRLTNELRCLDLTEEGKKGTAELVAAKPAPSVKETPGQVLASTDVTGSAEGLLAAGSAGQWPAFRGPGRLAVAEDKNTAIAWNAKSGEGIRWRAEVPLGGSSSPVVWGERVFLTGAVEGQAAVFCFDAKLGKLLWRRDVRLAGKVQLMSKDTGYAAPTPVTDGKHVFAVFATGDVAAFGLDGTPAWSVSLGVPNIPSGYASSPALFKDLLLIQYDQESKEEGNAALLALDTQNGKTVWRVKRSMGPSWSSPLVIGTRRGPQVVAVACGGVAAYDPSDGSEIWAVRYESRDLAPSPGLAKGRVIAPIAGGGTLAISPDGKGDVTKTHVAWFNEDAVSEVPSPVGYGDWVYLLSYGKLLCLNAADGKEAGSRDVDGQFFASPVVAGGKLYLVSREGKATVLKAGPACEVVGEAAVGEPVSATPAVVGGCLFVRTAKSLYCIGPVAP